MTRLLVRHLAVCMGCAVLAIVVAALAGWDTRVGYALALAGLAAVASLAVRRVGSTMVEAMWPLPFPPEPVKSGVDTRIGALESLLRRSAEDPSIFTRRLQPLLAGAATHRLRREHGVDPASQPELVRRLVGDDVWTMLTDAPGGLVAPADIERAVTAIERLAP